VRGIVPDLASGVPIAQRLPGVYQEEEFTQRFVSTFDTALAPVIATLDGLPGYVDPWLAPTDFLDWLAGWVGVEIDEEWTVPQRRQIVSGAALMHRRRGTAAGIADVVRLTVDDECDVEVEESGTSLAPVMTVRVRVPNVDSVDVRRVEALVVSVKPAHVAHVLEVVPTSERAPEHREE
jgi:phage tail-like protein